MLRLLVNQFEKQLEEQEAQEVPQGRRGRRFTYSSSSRLMLLFFLQMHHQRRYTFQAQHRWLLLHPHQARHLGFDTLPHRTTLMRRYKRLSHFLEQLIPFIAAWARDLWPVRASPAPARPLRQDKSLFKASGPVWHQRDRAAGVVPVGLGRLDKDATWGKSRYHGWVYGFGLHLSVNEQGFPLLAQVESACVSEARVVAAQEEALLALEPTEVVGDDAYTNLERAKTWARHGVAWLAPGLKLGAKGDAGAYKRFLQQPHNQALLQKRRHIEPLFDLLSQLAGVRDNHKQLPVQGLPQARSFLLGCVLLLQLAMILNHVWKMPPRNISHMMALWA